MVYPIPGVPITTAYNIPGPWWKSGHHQGVDFATPRGTPYAATADGIVIGTGDVWGSAFGDNQVVIDHVINGVDYYTIYAHGDTENVNVGDTVKAGQIIGTTGAKGNVTGPHLHLEAHTVPHWDTTTDVNPAPLLAYNEQMADKPGTTSTQGHAQHTAGTTIPVTRTPQINTALYSTPAQPGIRPPGEQPGQFNPGNIIPGVSEISRFVRIITDGQFWIRVIEMAAGAGLIIWGVTILSAGAVGVGSVSDIAKLIK